MTSLPASILALDVGERRIGVAIAHLPPGLPEPWGVIEQSPTAQDEIKELAARERAQTVVVGLPRGLEGQHTAQTKSVEEFTASLKKVVGLPVEFQDEALTSQKATEELENRGIRYNKGAVDALAATYILSDWLAEHQELLNGAD